MVRGLRPDFHLVAGGCTLFVGEDKQPGDMKNAVGDLKHKCTGLNSMHYGSVGLMAYAAAGPLVQLFYLKPNLTGQVHLIFADCRMEL